MRVAFAPGQGATNAIFAHPDLPFEIKKELLESKPYREGRPLRIEITNESSVDSVKKIIKIKTDH